MLDELLIKFPDAKEALVLDEQFNSCILRFENGVFVYSAECVIEQLTSEIKDVIQNGILELYGDLDLEESAETYAIEHFEYNMESAQGPALPIYEYETETED